MTNGNMPYAEDFSYSEDIYFRDGVMSDPSQTVLYIAS